VILFAHNPDYYLTANIAIYWDDVGGPGTPAVRADGYDGRPGLTGSGDHAYVRKYAGTMGAPPIHPVGNEFRVGGRYLFESLPASPTGFISVINAIGVPNVQVVLNPDGTLSIYRGVDEIKASATVLDLDTFYRIGFKGAVRRTGGYAEIYINGVLLTRFNGNTASTDVVQWDGIEFGLIEDSAVSHVYFGDNSGFLTDLIPGLITKVIQPSADGTFEELTPSSGDDAFQMVDDSNPDGDTTTIDAADVGDRGTFTHDTLSATERIYAVQPTAVVKAADDGPGMRHIVVLDGAPYPGLGSTVHAPSTSYVACREMIYHLPDNGNAWSDDAVNAREYGVETV
jgi:hypothetical protein